MAQAAETESFDQHDEHCMKQQFGASEVSDVHLERRT